MLASGTVPWLFMLEVTSVNVSDLESLLFIWYHCLLKFTKVVLLLLAKNNER